MVTQPTDARTRSPEGVSSEVDVVDVFAPPREDYP